jgi:hypothetical protein
VRRAGRRVEPTPASTTSVEPARCTPPAGRPALTGASHDRRPSTTGCLARLGPAMTAGPLEDRLSQMARMCPDEGLNHLRRSAPRSAIWLYPTAGTIWRWLNESLSRATARADHAELLLSPSRQRKSCSRPCLATRCGVEEVFLRIWAGCSQASREEKLWLNHCG